MTTYFILAGAAFLAGVVNSVAGGGSFLTFPALVFAGVPSIVANASSTVALVPAIFASAWAFRNDLREFEEVSLKSLLAVSIAGGTTGAILLLYTPQSMFDVIVPWLLLGSTLAFAFGRQAAPALQRMFRIGPSALLLTQFLIAIYGGYFGGAVGLVMLAAWSLFGFTDLRSMMAKRTLLGGAMNAAAVLCFVLAGKIAWAYTTVMVAGGIAGGYYGAQYARGMNPARVRLAVIVIGIVTTIIFFVRGS